MQIKNSKLPMPNQSLIFFSYFDYLYINTSYSKKIRTYLENGIYFVILETNDGLLTTKIIVNQ